MDRESARERRRIATQKAAAALAERRDQARQRATEPPRPGDTFLLRQTAEYPVEWVIVERRGEDGRLLSVPLDDFPFAGSRDVGLARRAPGGAATVRCDLGVWLDAGAFDTELRTGALAAEDLARVRERRRASLEGRLVPSFPEQEVDGDPEYRQWREETLRPALDALSGAPVGRETRRGEGAVRRWAVPLALAASAVLVVKLSTLQEARQLRDALDAERLRAERLEAALDGAAEVNLPIFELRSGLEERGGVSLVALPPEARRLALALEVEDPEYYPRYRLRIMARSSAEVIWQTAELVKTGSWLHLGLPAAFFETGKEYELRLEGLAAGGWVELEERYLIEVREP